MPFKKALQSQGFLTSAKEVASGQEAIDDIEEGNIHVAFLEVDMPGINGIEAAKQILDIHPKCIIVFVTAHETYMQDAFQLYAFDYIICVNKIRKIEIYGRWTYVVKFRGTEKDALTTKEKSKELEEKYYLF